MAILLYKMGMSNVEEYSWSMTEFQDHFIIPEIGEVIENKSADGEVISYTNKDQNSTVLFWLSMIERTSLTGVRMDIREGYDSKTGDTQIRKSRVSKYLISVEGIIKYLEMIGNKEFTKNQKPNIKNSFYEFIETVREYDEVSVVKEKFDSKNKLETIVLEISANRYFQVNEFLYDKTILRSKNDFRFIKNSVAVFISVIRAARKRFLNGVIDSEKNSDSKLQKMKLIFDKSKISDQKAFSGLSYKKIESNVCFKYIGTIAEGLELNRKTVANQIQFLSEWKIISYVVVREWNNRNERYFITDSFSEFFLADYILHRYRSNNRYDIVEISSIYGRAYSQDSSNSPSENYDKVDITAEKFERARLAFSRNMQR